MMVHLNNLQLTNFRCYRNLKMNFSNKINIFVGDNAVGKTSIVEAIHCLGFAKSHKANNDFQMIKNGESFAVIKANFEKDDKKDEIVISLSDKGKKIQRNNKVYNNISEYIGYLNVVMFCPEDLNIIKGSPSERRKFLDTNISQIRPDYLKSLIIYRKLLRQRNEILKNINDNKYDYDLLMIVTKEMAKEAKRIVLSRLKFIDKLNPYLKEKALIISDHQETSEIRYLSNLDFHNYEKEFIEAIDSDIFARTTTKGPHRDDFSIEINAFNLAIYGSQGQQRTIALAIKLAVADLIKETSDNLIIILDDVFSELDINRQNEILRVLNQANQIFITTTTVENLSASVLEDSKVITIRKEVEFNG